MRLFWKAGWHWVRNDAGILAAALAYLMPFALIPLLVISTTIASLVVGQGLFVETVTGWGNAMAPDLTDVILVGVDNFQRDTGFYGVPIIGYLFFAWMIMYTFSSLVFGLNRVWGVAHQGFSAFVASGLRSLLFFLILQLYFVILIVAFAMIPGIGWLAPVHGFIEPVVIFTLTVALFYIAFSLLSWSPPSRRARLIGSLVVAIAFIFLRQVVTWWIAATPAIDFFGTAGLLLGLLVWVYLTAAVVYYGAAVAWVYDKE